MIRFAFAGLQHGHIKTLYDLVSAHPECEVAAVWDSELSANFGIQTTCTDFERMLNEVPFEVLAIGDVYGRRGSLAIAGLQHGKHILGDKPLCTRLCELDEICRLATINQLQVGCMLDLREYPNVVKAKEIFDSGRPGEVYAVQFGGQHPLNFGSRPQWYFTPENHGGTINDIAIHALDLINFLTGEEYLQADFARVWNVKRNGNTTFEDGAQIAFRLSNQAGCIGDVSYFAPDQTGYALPYYWRFTFWCANGVLEFNIADSGVRYSDRTTNVPEIIPAEGSGKSHLDCFLDDLKGTETSLTASHVLNVTRQALTLQELANHS